MFLARKYFWVLLVTIFLGKASESDSGKATIMKIMSHDETGVSAFNKKNIHYAQTMNIYKDLNIPEIAKFFPCKTEIGRNFIAETLSVPVSPQDKNTILAHRQNAIKILVENPELKKEVEELLDQAKSEEAVVVELMSDFFKGKSCPEILSLKQLKEQQSPLYSTLRFLLTEDKGRSLLEALNLYFMFQTAYFTGKYAIPASCNLLKARIWSWDAIKVHASSGFLISYTALLAWMNGREYKNSYDIRLKLHSLNRLISIAEQFEALCSAHDIKNQFNISAIQSKEGTSLINALKHSRYSSKHTFLFRTPAVHTFLYDLYERQQHLAELFACIAEMDAYNALATQMLESQTTKNKFCFVDYIENPTPVIRGKSFWNVLVKNAVPSSINESKKIILSGPNAGGKTTSIRAILQNIVLAQTFGIAAAESFEMTMFDVIHSYLNISDDLLNGLSLFASEIKRAQDLLECIRNLDQKQKMFFALDELFTGTVAEDGETCALAFIDKVADFDCAQFVYATHFQKLKELAKTNVQCVNYKVDSPTKGQDGKFVYPYTLSQGASDSRVAIDLAKQAGLFDKK